MINLISYQPCKFEKTKQEIRIKSLRLSSCLSFNVNLFSNSLHLSLSLSLSSTSTITRNASLPWNQTNQSRTRNKIKSETRSIEPTTNDEKEICRYFKPWRDRITFFKGTGTSSRFLPKKIKRTYKGVDRRREFGGEKGYQSSHERRRRNKKSKRRRLLLDLDLSL